MKGASRSRVSVVVTNHNYARFLPTAVESVLGQTYQPVEVIVVDDGSTDESRAVLAGMNRVRVVLQPNRGQTAAMNAGFAASTGDPVVFLDADDSLDVETLERVVAAFDDPSVSVIHWPLREIDAAGRESGRVHPRSAMPSGDLADRVLAKGPESYERPPTSGNAWRRAFLAAVMPLPEVETQLGYGSAHADAFLTDLAAFFGTVAVLDGAGGNYRVHGTNDYASKDDRRRFEREVWCYNERCRRLAQFLRARGRHVDVDAWARGAWVHQVAATFEDIITALGDDTPFVLMDEQQLPVLTRPGRAIPFTSRDGVYCGPPSDDEEGVRELETRRGSGVSAVVVAWPAFWWLQHFEGIRHHLEQTGCLVLQNERVMIYRL